MNIENRILLLFTLVLSASCVQEGTGVSMPLEVAAEIGYTRTRADDPHASDYDKRSFDTNDVIRITRTGSASGIDYKRTATGAWTPADAATLMTTTGGETFIATFPSTFTGIQPDQRTYTAFWESNQLSATATASGNRVSFSFAPAACKVTVVIIYKAENTAVGTTLTGKGLYSGNQSLPETIQLLKTSESLKRHTYSGIFSPKAAAVYTITVQASVLGTGIYEEKGVGLTLLAGHEYQYTFTATDELILNSVIVKDFTKDPSRLDEEENAGNAT